MVKTMCNFCKEVFESDNMKEFTDWVANHNLPNNKDSCKRFKKEVGK